MVKIDISDDGRGREKEEIRKIDGREKRRMGVEDKQGVGNGKSSERERREETKRNKKET